MYTEIDGNLIHKTAVIDWDSVVIGTGNKIGPYCCIGEDAQHPRKASAGIIRIGNNNTIREFCRINKPTSWDSETTIGDDNYIMAGSHVDHDCVLEDNIRFSTNTILSGNVYIMRGCVLGLGVLIHQQQVIGSYSMLGMGAIITKSLEVLPGHTYVGNPDKLLKLNSIGLERNLITKKDLTVETIRFQTLRRRFQE